MKYPTSLRGWERMMQEIPGFTRVKKAVRLREEAEASFNRADPAEDPEYVDIATLELTAAAKRVNVEIRRAKGGQR